MPKAGRHSTPQRLAIRIDEVDLVNRIVHGHDKTNVLVIATFRETPASILYVPAQGERWLCQREGMGQWRLVSRLDSADQQTWAVENLGPGDMRIEADDIWLKGTIHGLPAPPTPTGRTLNAIIDGSGSVLQTGIAGDVFIDFQCWVTKWTLLADQTGSIQVDIWNAPYASYPPTVTNTLLTSSLYKPKIISGTHNKSTYPIPGWPVTLISPGSCLRFNIDSVTSIERLVIALTLVTD